MRPTIHLFRNDLRLDDNPALSTTARAGPVIPVFVLDDAAPGNLRLGGASRWWLHHSLSSLAADLGRMGSRLIIRRGDTASVVAALAKTSAAGAVALTRGYSPWDRSAEDSLHAKLAENGIALRRFGGNLLFEPEAVQTGAGGPFKIFTPFWRACLALDAPGRGVSRPATLTPPDDWPENGTIDDLDLLPRRPDWSAGLAEAWRPGEAGAADRLSRFLQNAVADYKTARDHPAEAGTSKLSPHLHFGEISPRRVWYALSGAVGAGSGGVDSFLREIGWREFCHHLLFHAPHLAERPLRPAFEAVPWATDGDDFLAWRQGRTGYPIVDAGMRELWRTGWMHNRVRMIAASFLTKHLLVDWRAGAAWFWDTLVDADAANNYAGWQWVAGCGSDAAPYFRVFNPVLQGEKFDASGVYVRRWIPELAGMTDRRIHQPWSASPRELSSANVALGETYPHPLVDHKAARQRALAAYGAVKTGS